MKYNIKHFEDERFYLKIKKKNEVRFAFDGSLKIVQSNKTSAIQNDD